MSFANASATSVQLADRQAIYDVVARYCRGVDRLDEQLVSNAFHPDAIVDYGMFVGNRDDFVKFALDLESSLKLGGQHFVANHLADIDGNNAHAETY